MLHVGAALLARKRVVGVQQGPLAGAHVHQRHRACRGGSRRRWRACFKSRAALWCIRPGKASAR